MRMDVVNNEGAHRFELVFDDGVAFLVYERHGDRLVLVHTEVPKPFEGRGCGGMLVRAAVDYARVHHLRVVPVCPFARAYLQRHPEYADRVDHGERGPDE
jgi:predicted GNAT family acetyltransferase